MLSGGDNESNQTVDRILSIGLHWTREALLESIEMSKAPDPNLFSRPCIAKKLGVTVKQNSENNNCERHEVNDQFGGFQLQYYNHRQPMK